jgi:hypothetical protein
LDKQKAPARSTGPLADTLSEAAVRDWQNQMVHRAITRLQSAAARYENSRLHLDCSPAVSAEDSIHEMGAQWLYESWSGLIEGQSASAEMLSRAANQQQELPLEQSSIRQPERGVTDTAMRPITDVTQAPRAEQVRDWNLDSPARARRTSVSEEFSTRGVGLVPSANAHDGAADAADSWLQPATAVARELAEELISSSHDEIWVPSPVASMRTGTSQRSGLASASLTRSDVPLLHRQELDGPEDLSGFSSRMKRVLDEEARRYGIDV